MTYEIIGAVTESPGRLCRSGSAIDLDDTARIPCSPSVFGTNAHA